MFRKITLMLLAQVLVFQLSAQTYAEYISTAEDQYDQEAYAESLASYQSAFKLEDGTAYDLYNAACCAALINESKTAHKLLKQANKAGYTNARHLQRDTDLNSLHGTKKWDKLVAKVQADLDAIEANYNKPLQAELIAIYEDDQAIRREFIAVANELGWDHPKADSLRDIMIVTDSINHIKIIDILDEHGWVGRDVVGGQANQAIFLVIQHSDIETQQKYLPMMREAVEQGNAQARSLALLEDRVALRTGKHQIYGSQIGRHPETEESYVLPLQDPMNVDERRASVGLGTLSEYVSRWDIEWDPEAYQKQLPEYEKLYFGEE